MKKRHIIILIVCLASFLLVCLVCFVLGAIHTIHPIFKKQYILTAILVFTIYYLCIINCIISAPIQILGNLAFATIVVNAIKIRKNYKLIKKLQIKSNYS